MDSREASEILNKVDPHVQARAQRAQRNRIIGTVLSTALYGTFLALLFARAFVPLWILLALLIVVVIVFSLNRRKRGVRANMREGQSWMSDKSKPYIVCYFFTIFSPTFFGTIIESSTIAIVIGSLLTALFAWVAWGFEY